MSISPIVERTYYKVTDFIFACIPQRRPSIEAARQAKVVAHRGIYDGKRVCENTLAAFDNAQAAELDGIEFDVRWTKDCLPVVIHDSDCQRVFNQKTTVAELTLDELRQQCPSIPSLSDVVARYGKRLHLMIELKQEPLLDRAKQQAALTQVLATLEPQTDYHLITLSPEMFLLGEAFPQQCLIPVALLHPRETSELAVSQHYGGLFGHYSILPNSLIKKHLDMNQVVGTGQIMSKNCLYRELNRGVQWIFTDDSVKMRSILKELV